MTGNLLLRARFTQCKVIFIFLIFLLDQQSTDILDAPDEWVAIASGFNIGVQNSGFFFIIKFLFHKSKRKITNAVSFFGRKRKRYRV